MHLVSLESYMAMRCSLDIIVILLLFAFKIVHRQHNVSYQNASHIYCDSYLDLWCNHIDITMNNDAKCSVQTMLYAQKAHTANKSFVLSYCLAVCYKINYTHVLKLHVHWESVNSPCLALI
jgi:hypothetical protein